MRKPVVCVLAVLILVAMAAPVQAQLGRAFVSTKGLDTNGCQPTAPCRTFQRAIDVISPRGEVVALDSGGFGSATITKSASIYVPLGIHAGCTVASGDGITINAAATDTVVLRGVHFNATGGNNAVVANTVGSLYMEHCQVAGFTENGVKFNAAGRLVMKNTDIRKAGAVGLIIAPTTGSAAGFVSASTFTGNQTGVKVGTGAVVTIADCSAGGNINGFAVDNPSGTGSALMTMTHIRSVDNDNGIVASATTGGTAVASFAYALITQNDVGILITGAGSARGSNPGTSVVSGNGTDISGSLGAAMTLY